jgi:hypothetical protein
LQIPLFFAEPIIFVGLVRTRARAVALAELAGGDAKRSRPLALVVVAGAFFLASVRRQFGSPYIANWHCARIRLDRYHQASAPLT